MWSIRTSNPSSPTDSSVRAQPSPRVKYPGKQVAQIIKIKPYFVDEFKKIQAKMWPEVLSQFKECNVEDYSIFHNSETHILFLTFKYVGFDWTGDVERIQENPKVKEWHEQILKYQEFAIPESEDGQEAESIWWQTMERIS